MKVFDPLYSCGPSELERLSLFCAKPCWSTHIACSFPTCLVLCCPAIESARGEVHLGRDDVKVPIHSYPCLKAGNLSHVDVTTVLTSPAVPTSGCIILKP